MASQKSCLGCTQLHRGCDAWICLSKVFNSVSIFEDDVDTLFHVYPETCTKYEEKQTHGTLNTVTNPHACFLD
jgi:hypothetical protein